MKVHFSALRNLWLRFRKKGAGTLSGLLLFLSLLGSAVVVYKVGFPLQEQIALQIETFFRLLLPLLFFASLLRSFLELSEQWGKWREKWPQYVMLLLLFLALDAQQWGLFIESDSGFLQRVLASHYTLHLLVLAVFGVEFSRSSLDFLKLNLNPALIFSLSFLLIIFLGTGLLLLPNATPEQGISLVDALFTSTSAVCVTGLIVVDTAHDFTELGQFFILLLVQIGGLGVMTFTTFFAFYFKGSTSYQSQLFLKNLVNEKELSNIFRTLVRIVVFTLSLEMAAAIWIFMLQPAGQFSSLREEIWFSVFHAVSAFCNAGFSTLSGSLAEGAFAEAYHLHLVVAVLVIIGGLGFPIIFNYFALFRSLLVRYWHSLIYRRRFVHRAWVINLNTKIVMYTTAALLIGGALAYWLLEEQYTLAGKSTYGKVVTVIFGTVTPRTAGFNTVDMSGLAMPTILIYLFMMWVGASPGSTGGGIKTSTLAISILNIRSLARGSDRVELFRREIAPESVRRAAAIVMLSLMAIAVSISGIALLEPEMELLDITFECFSAYSTVGLSLGITPELSSPSKVLLMITMFVGRVGMLSLLTGMLRQRQNFSYRYPRESIFIK